MLTDSDLVGPDPKFRTVFPDPAVGLLSLEPESSPEWLLWTDSDRLGSGSGPLLPETDPDELELLLVVVVTVSPL